MDQTKLQQLGNDLMALLSPLIIHGALQKIEATDRTTQLAQRALGMLQQYFIGAPEAEAALRLYKNEPSNVELQWRITQQVVACFTNQHEAITDLQAVVQNLHAATNTSQQERSHHQTITGNPQIGIAVSGDVHGGITTGPNVTLAISPSAISAYHQLPAPNVDFVGRKEDIKQLVDMLCDRDNKEPITRIVGILGLGGIGKTQLALVVANHKDVISHFPDIQIYINLQGENGTPLQAITILQTIVYALDPLAPSINNLAQLQAHYRTLLTGKRALILADDSEDEAQLRLLLPPSGCALLITSRQRFTLPGMAIVDLKKLSHEESKSLLHIVEPRIGPQASLLSDLCGGLPLALRISASLLKVDQTLAVSEYIDELFSEKERLTHLQDPEKPHDPHVSVRASFSLSYKKLHTQSQHILAQLSVFRGNFDRKAVTEILIPIESIAEEDFPTNNSHQDYLRQLYHRSLVDWDDRIKRYSVHELVRLYAAENLTSIL